MTIPSFVLELVAGRFAIRCLLCDSLSFSPGDLGHCYCGRCHLFHPEVMRARLDRLGGAAHECEEWRTARGACAVCGRALEAPATGRVIK
jgi:hypothetical protein